MVKATVTVQAWPHAEAPTEAIIRQQLEAERLSYYAWGNGPGDVYAAHTHAYHKVIYVVQGSITFGLPAEGKQIQLNPGDRMDLPSGIRHEAVVGPEGVLCLEGHRYS
jgi:quercetin dioxygenase-like cupin family protein